MNTAKFILPGSATVFNRTKEVSSFGEETFRKLYLFQDVHTLKLSKDKVRFVFGILYFISLLYSTVNLFV